MDIVPANLAKRSGAAFLDFFLAILLWLTLISLVFSPIYNQVYDIPTLTQNYDDIRLASHLYVTDPETELVSIVAIEDAPSAIYAYYSEFKDGLTYEGETDPFAFTNEWYNTDILNIGSTEEGVTVYFQYDVDDLDQPDPSKVGIPLTSATEEELDAFYEAELQAAHYDLLDYPPFSALVSQINGYAIQIFIISASISLAIFYLMFPLILKNGQTLGKRIFSLGVVSAKGYRIKPWQTIVRFFVFVAEIAVSLYTFLGAILISYTLMIFSKKNRSVHDFIAGTSVINLKSSLVFDNEDDEAAYRRRVAEDEARIAEEKRRFAPQDIIDAVPLPKEGE